MRDTKRKILEAAIHLFNTKGLPNVKLQHIADYCGVSVGNLAYHYRTKDILLKTIDRQIQDDIETIVSSQKDFPYLIDFDNQLSNYFYYINKYAFYFLDVLELERCYPQLQEHRVLSITKMMAQIRKWIDLNVNNQIIKQQISEDQYETTTRIVWMTISFWMTQQKVLGKKGSDEGLFKEDVWNLIVPLLTENGLLEYEAIILPQLANLKNAISQ
ncbi:MAG: TetR/AcrR family transcriptional regulator [Saprospiraceae bacterium]|nr:TetR/AcrR family transcriptional regulator [Saprospiraceae bacterium]